jgi:hypothetical protein
MPHAEKLRENLEEGVYAFSALPAHARMGLAAAHLQAAAVTTFCALCTGLRLLFKRAMLRARRSRQKCPCTSLAAAPHPPAPLAHKRLHLPTSPLLFASLPAYAATRPAPSPHVVGSTWRATPGLAPTFITALSFDHRLTASTPGRPALRASHIGPCWPRAGKPCPQPPAFDDGLSG